AGELAPLPLEEQSLSHPAAAFRRMAQGAHVGKIVLLRREEEEAQLDAGSAGPLALDRGATYLVTGGYGALGLTFAAWLLDRGAGVVALLGRSGPLVQAAERMAELERRHGRGRLALLRGDVADEESLARVLAEAGSRLPPLRGVLHAAGILDDRSLLQLDDESCRRVLAPKVRGAWNLHRLTAGRDLHLFVLFASAAGLLGSAGQASYAAGNAFLDGLAHYRRSRGLPALAMDWGPVAGIGLAAARDDRGRRLEEEGIRSLAPEECPALLEAALACGVAQAGAIDLAGVVSALPLLAEVCAVAAPGDSGGTPLRQRLASLPSDAERLELLSAHLAEQVARVVRCPVETLAVDTPFKGLGLDSLLALQLAKRLGESLGLTVPVTSFWTYPTLLAYRGFLAAQLGFGAAPGCPATPPTPPASPADDAVAREIAELSEEEAESRLLEKLAAVPELISASAKSKVHETM
ncbi:MAG TPA: SDR family NAD(P)-dependent oxidoreductase, partial [Thermoanaerobaculia bacterium]|nr:SDR family NAD(P)-dependent oxidoreductase [Thermoanaerobaculia bacterium]